MGQFEIKAIKINYIYIDQNKIPYGIICLTSVSSYNDVKDSTDNIIYVVVPGYEWYSRCKCINCEPFASRRKK